MVGKGLEGAGDLMDEVVGRVFVLATLVETNSFHWALLLEVKCKGILFPVVVVDDGLHHLKVYFPCSVFCSFFAVSLSGLYIAV